MDLLHRIKFTAILWLLQQCSLFAFINNDLTGINQQYQPNGLIIRLNSNIKPDISKGKSGIISIGIESFDGINMKYAITKQEYLLPECKRNSLPNNFSNLFIIIAPEKVDIYELKKEYENLDYVEYVELDRSVELYEMPNDPLYSHQWSLNNTGQGYYAEDGVNQIIEYGTIDADIDFNEYYENKPDVTNTVVVAIIDTGIDMDHPDLIGNIWTNIDEIPDNGIDDDHNGYIDDIHGWDFYGDSVFSPDNDPTDDYGHGTHCAGIVAAMCDNGIGITGIADDVQIMALKFYPIPLHSVVINSILYAADNGADVISMSWGSFFESIAIQDALNYAKSRGVVLCAAAGNSGCVNGQCDPPISYPAAYPGVIAVAATNSNDHVTSFSSFGDHIDICSPGNMILSLRADSTDMYTDLGEPLIHIVEDVYYLANGTSMACPATAAAAACLRELSQGLSSQNIEEILEITSDDLIDPYGIGQNFSGWDRFSGHGRLNLYNAMTYSSIPDLRTKIETPQPSSIAGGLIIITGTADGNDFQEYTLEYGYGRDPVEWYEITTSNYPVTNSTLGEWESGLLNGQFTIRLRSGETNFHLVTIYIINDDINVQIQYPQESDTIRTMAEITGSALCSNFSHYILDFSYIDVKNEWTEIDRKDYPVFSEILSTWVVEGLTEGNYFLRLSVFNDEQLIAADTVIIYVQSLYAGDNAWKVTIDNNICPFPTFADIDDDGLNEIMIGTDHGIAFYNTDGTSKITGIPVIPDYDFTFPIAVGNLNNDGIDDFAAMAVNDSAEGKIFVYLSSDSAFEWDLPQLPIYGQGYKQIPYVSLKDIDDDGIDEIHSYQGFMMQTHRARYFIYSPYGDLIMEVPDSGGLPGHSTYISADLDGNGSDEMYTTGYNGVQHVLYQYSLDNPTIPENSINLTPPDHELFRFSPEELSAVDIDNDGKLELIVPGYCYIDNDNYWIFAFDENLELKEGWPHNTQINQYWSPFPPVFSDINNDSTADYFMAYNSLTSGYIAAWDINGNPLNGNVLKPDFAVLPEIGKINQMVIADITGDGFPSLLVNVGPDVYWESQTEKLIAWDNNGMVVDGWPILTVTQTQNFESQKIKTPVVGDINKDGFIDLITTTGLHELIYINFEGKPYDPSNVWSAGFRLNRRLNNTQSAYVSETDCGNVNNNGGINILDITYLIANLYKGGPPPDHPESADVNNDGNINILDITYLIAYLYKGGPEPDCI